MSPRGIKNLKTLLNNIISLYLDTKSIYKWDINTMKTDMSYKTVWQSKDGPVVIHDMDKNHAISIKKLAVSRIDFLTFLNPSVIESLINEILGVTDYNNLCNQVSRISPEKIDIAYIKWIPLEFNSDQEYWIHWYFMTSLRIIDCNMNYIKSLKPPDPEADNKYNSFLTKLEESHDK